MSKRVVLRHCGLARQCAAVPAFRCTTSLRWCSNAALPRPRIKINVELACRARSQMRPTALPTSAAASCCARGSRLATASSAAGVAPASRLRSSCARCGGATRRSCQARTCDVVGAGATAPLAVPVWISRPQASPRCGLTQDGTSVSLEAETVEVWSGLKVATCLAGVGTFIQRSREHALQYRAPSRILPLKLAARSTAPPQLLVVAMRVATLQAHVPFQPLGTCCLPGCNLDVCRPVTSVGMALKFARLLIRHFVSSAFQELRRQGVACAGALPADQRQTQATNTIVTRRCST